MLYTSVMLGLNSWDPRLLGSPLGELFLLGLYQFLEVCVALNLFLSPGIKGVYHQCLVV